MKMNEETSKSSEDELSDQLPKWVQLLKKLEAKKDDTS